jgi:hypothetical protein
VLSKITLLFVKFKEVMGGSARRKSGIYFSKTNFIYSCLKLSETNRKSDIFGKCPISFTLLKIRWLHVLRFSFRHKCILVGFRRN